MKKILATLIAVCLFSSLTGCDWFNTSSTEKSYSETIQEFEGSVEVVPYYYSQLTDIEKAAYISIVNAINNSDDKAEVPSIDEDSLKKITSAVSYDNPQFLWLSKSWTITHYVTSSQIEIPYLLSADERKEMSQELESKITRIMRGINIAMGDYEKELYFHDYLVENCIYDSAATSDDEHINAYTAYGALIEGKAVCEGYARAMQILLTRAGVESYLVIGTAVQNGVNESHMWNAVKVGSDWYHLDVTWDDPRGNSAATWHTYFNLSDEEIGSDHFFEEKTQCNSSKANFYRKNSTFFTSFNSSSFADALADEIYNAKQMNLNFVEVKFSNQSDFIAAKQAIFQQQLLFVATNRVYNRYSLKIDTSNVYGSTFDTQLVIGISF